MSNDEKKLYIKVNDALLYGYIGKNPILKQGKTSLYTRLSFYDSRLPDAANPVVVTAFGDDAEVICQACESFDEKQFIKLTCRQFAVGKITNSRTKSSRIGLYAIATRCEAHVKPDKETSDKPSESKVTTEHANSEVNNGNQQAVVEAAVTLLKQNGLSVNAASE